MKVELRKEARRLREEGRAINEIARILGVSKASVSVWVRDIELTEEQKAQLQKQQRSFKAQTAGAQANREKFREFRLEYQEAGRAKAREGSLLHMAGCMLYWGEGAKGKDRVSFANSDSGMIRFYMRFLREELQIEDSIITVSIHCHTPIPEEIRRIEQYWLDLVALPATALRKTIIKKSDAEGSHRILPYGVCRIHVYRTELVQHILGAIQEYAGFENEEWLG